MFDIKKYSLTDTYIVESNINIGLLTIGMLLVSVGTITTALSIHKEEYICQEKTYKIKLDGTIYCIFGNGTLTDSSITEYYIDYKLLYIGITFLCLLVLYIIFSLIFVNLVLSHRKKLKQNNTNI